MTLPVVCIIGRPNVGKSSLFNRILRKRKAVVDPTPGVTRDRLYGVAEWDDRSFALIDTGGLILQSDEEMQRNITAQAEIAIHESDVVLFMLDGISGPQQEDQAIAQRILRSGKPTVVAVNKIDKQSQLHDVYEFTKLGPFDPIGISVLGGRMIGDLLDRVNEAIESTGRFDVVANPFFGADAGFAGHFCADADGEDGC